MVERGRVPFVDMALAVQSAGGKALIVGNAPERERVEPETYGGLILAQLRRIRGDREDPDEDREGEKWQGQGGKQMNAERERKEGKKDDREEALPTSPQGLEEAPVLHIMKGSKDKDDKVTIPCVMVSGGIYHTLMTAVTAGIGLRCRLAASPHFMKEKDSDREREALSSISATRTADVQLDLSRGNGGMERGGAKEEEDGESKEAITHGKKEEEREKTHRVGGKVSFIPETQPVVFQDERGRTLVMRERAVYYNAAGEEEGA